MRCAYFSRENGYSHRRHIKNNIPSSRSTAATSIGGAETIYRKLPRHRRPQPKEAFRFTGRRVAFTHRCRTFTSPPVSFSRARGDRAIDITSDGVAPFYETGPRARA